MIASARRATVADRPIARDFNRSFTIGTNLTRDRWPTGVVELW